MHSLFSSKNVFSTQVYSRQLPLSNWFLLLALPTLQKHLLCEEPVEHLCRIGLIKKRAFCFVVPFHEMMKSDKNGSKPPIMCHEFHLCLWSFSIFYLISRYKVWIIACSPLISRPLHGLPYAENVVVRLMQMLHRDETLSLGAVGQAAFQEGKFNLVIQLSCNFTLYRVLFGK